MWHRIIDDKIVESINEFGDAHMRELSRGELWERYGWTQSTTPPKPAYDPDDYTVRLICNYDKYSGIVTEHWEIIPINPNDPTYIESQSSIERRIAREHPDLVIMMQMTPQEVSNHIDVTFSTLNANQKRTLRAMAVAIRVLANNRKLL